MIPGAHLWELARDHHLATTEEEKRDLWLEILARRFNCKPHIPNPEHPERCYKCGVSPVPAQALDSKPGPVKVRRPPLDVRKVG